MASTGYHSGDVDLNVPTVPDIHEQPASAPDSPDHGEETRADGHSSTGTHVDLPRDNEQAGPSRLMDGEHSGSEGDSTGESTGTDSDDDSGTDSESHTGENGEELQSAPRAAGEELGDGSQQINQDAESFTGGYSFSGVGGIELKVEPAITVPHHYSWITSAITTKKSMFGAGADLTDVIAQLIGRSGRRGVWVGTSTWRCGLLC